MEDSGESLVFRNYEPISVELKKNKLENTKPLLFSNELKEYLENIERDIEIDTLDLTLIAPKKPHIDLKKHVASSLEYLQKKTNREIINYIYEFKSNNNDNINLSELVGQHAENKQ